MVYLKYNRSFFLSKHSKEKIKVDELTIKSGKKKDLKINKGMMDTIKKLTRTELKF